MKRMLTINQAWLMQMMGGIVVVSMTSPVVANTVNGYLSGMDTVTQTNIRYQNNSEATKEAIAAASLPNSPILTTTGHYQQVPDNSKVFGAQLFRGAFANTSGASFNDSYIIQQGDNVQLRMWGAYQFAATMTVDPQGNIFIPNVGPVRIAGIRNGDLQNVVKTAVGRIYRANVGVYVSLQSALPVRVFVTGFVNQPGYYAGVAADSVLSYLDRAGGVDSQRGSYIDIQIRRYGQLVQQVNLYNFLLAGQLEPFSFQDGDVITVGAQKKSFNISGEVQNPYTFEFGVDNLTVADVMSVANPKPIATHVSITRSAGRAQKSEYYSLQQAGRIKVYNGDKLVVTSDRYAATIAVQVRGGHTGNGALILPYGSKLKDVVSQLQPTSMANLSALKIYRESVAQQQKQNINQALDRLQEMSLATQSITKEEASLRQIDAQMIEKFIEKARKIKPDGQIVVLPHSWQEVILQQGDIIEIPEQTSVISVNGEIRTQGALTYHKNMTVGQYVAKSGGFNANANTKEIIVIRQNGENIVTNSDYIVQQGEQIMVLPEVKTKKVEITRGLSQILYQIAIAAKVVLNL